MKIPFILLMTALLLLQSCTVYKRTQLSLEGATHVEGPFKIETSGGIDFHMKRIWKNENTYFGDPVWGGMDTVVIDHSSVTAIYPIDCKKTRRNRIIGTSPIWVPAALLLGYLLSWHI